MAARRGVWLVFSLILLAVAISMSGVAASYLLFNRGPSVPSRTTLDLRLTGDVAELQGSDLFEQLMPEQPTVRGCSAPLCIVPNTTSAAASTRVFTVSAP